MPKYRMTLRYEGYADTTVEANSREEAMEIALESMVFTDFDGGFEVEDIDEIEDDDEE